MAAVSFEMPIFGSDPKSPPLHHAKAHGITRIELNAAGSYKLGGTTPSIYEFRDAKNLGWGRCRIMIRPRGPPPPPGQDFIYSEGEFAAMRNSIMEFKESNMLGDNDGFVFGILKRLDGQLAVDVERNKELVRLAGPFKCVFHRAFDDVVGSDVESWRKALDYVHACGFDGILTSGGPGSAPQNVGRLKDIVSYAKGKVEIILGGGVRSHNVDHLVRSIGAGNVRDGNVWFHSSCLASGGEAEILSTKEVESMAKFLRSYSAQ